MSGISRPRPPQAPGPSHLPIDSIKVGQRHRRDPGDIPALAANIREIGLLHPLPVKPNGELIAGARRLAACKHLGWTEVPVHVVDLDVTVKGEYAENEYRKSFLPSENVAIKRELEQLEKAAAKERQREGGRAGGKASGKLPTGSKGRAADMAAKRTGMARRTLEKAEAVVAAAEAEPDKYGPLVEQMDRTGKVDGAHRRLLEARGEMEARGDVSKLETRTDTQGRNQPSRKPSSRGRRAAVPDDAELIAALSAAPHWSDAAWTQVLDQLPFERFMRVKPPSYGPKLARLKPQYSDPQARRLELVAAQTDNSAPPPIDDDELDIPDYLDRTKRPHA
jgi:ParB-like chromosome segregation protein Spo0J